MSNNLSCLIWKHFFFCQIRNGFLSNRESVFDQIKAALFLSRFMSFTSQLDGGQRTETETEMRRA